MTQIKLKFRGGPWDGGVFLLPTEKQDIGYTMEWACRLHPDGPTHIYSSQDPLLEDTAELTLHHSGSNNQVDEPWKPGWQNEWMSDQDWLEFED
jgi:hypothetical protein